MKKIGKRKAGSERKKERRKKDSVEERRGNGLFLFSKNNTNRLIYTNAVPTFFSHFLLFLPPFLPLPSFVLTIINFFVHALITAYASTNEPYLCLCFVMPRRSEFLAGVEANVSEDAALLDELLG